MPRITIFLIILFLSACGKTENKTETAQDSASVIITEAESQPLTEAECWKLFDTFWVEFQKAVVEKGYYDDCFSEFTIEMIRKINKKNNYNYFKKNKNEIEKYTIITYFDMYEYSELKENNMFILEIGYTNPKEFLIYYQKDIYIVLRNGKYLILNTNKRIKY